MALFIVACIGGLVLLTKAADWFVIGAARLAVSWQISPIVIGAVVIGFGTSAPEMFVSGIAAAGGDLDLGIGNIVGSNIANLSLVLGVAGLVVPIRLGAGVLRREAPLCAGSCLVFAVLAWDGLARLEGLAMSVLLLVILGYLIMDAVRGGGDAEFEDEVVEYVDGVADPSDLREAGRTLAGLVGTLVGAHFLVWGAVGIAKELSLSQGFVGLTLVAVGTSLPELVTAIVAARKGEDELIIGNLLGSNIFNSLAVGGLIALLGPGAVTDLEVARSSMLLMLGVVAAAWLFMATGRRVQRWEAGVLLGVYAVSVPLLGVVG